MLETTNILFFAIWLSKLPENGTVLKLSTLNKKFGLNYRTTKDFLFQIFETCKNQFEYIQYAFVQLYLQQRFNFHYSFLTRTILENKSAVYTRELPFESSGTNIAQSEKLPED